MSGKRVVTQAAVARSLAKPGYKTTELAAAVVAFAGSLAALLGAFNVDSSIGDAVIKLGALVAAGLTAFGYSHARAKTKAALVSITPNLPESSRNDTGDIGTALIGAVLIVCGVVIALTVHPVWAVGAAVIVAVLGLILLIVGAVGTRGLRL